MPTTRSAQDSATRWSQRAGQAAADYAARASAAAAKWASNVAASGNNWSAGVSGPGAQARFLSHTQAAGTQGFSAGVTNKGASRYPGGVQAGMEKYSRNVAPYLAIIQGVTLPAKGPRGSPQNDARVTAITHALSARRMGTTAAGR